ncbi:hypothetical protein [Chryseobacterium lacus]|uniref:hypothetical protein n=1 Tax=Chryseobacterium lacus TaxID=2058346 RepID=UPI001409C27C|nr:hypothetical protein [Chryseobacterium lacus]
MVVPLWAVFAEKATYCRIWGAGFGEVGRWGGGEMERGGDGEIGRGEALKTLLSFVHLR